jgi:hypothetical protein
METLTELRSFVSNPHFRQQRQQSLSQLDTSTIDPPILDLVSDLGRLPCCFTLQSCFGHFLTGGRDEPRSTRPLPVSGSVSEVEYRIAYLALCIEDSEPGSAFFDDLRRMTAIDPEYIQFACAEWFWERQVNSYVLQVEPAGYKTRDRALITYGEALYTERIRDRFYAELRLLVQDRLRTAAHC